MPNGKMTVQIRPSLIICTCYLAGAFFIHRLGKVVW